MRRTPLIALAMLAPILALAQIQPAGPPQAALTLQILPQGSEKGFPKTFLFALTNRTDHDLRVPMPSVNCGSDDSIWLRMHFVPLNPARDAYGHGCAADGWSQPLILERVKKWQVLRPGESITVSDTLKQLYMDMFEPGTYDLWAEYSPPFVSLEDQKILASAGISIPQIRTSSSHLSYVKQP